MTESREWNQEFPEDDRWPADGSRFALEPDPIPIQEPETGREIEADASELIDIVRQQTSVVPFAAIDSANAVAFGPFASIEDAVTAIRTADFTWDEFGTAAAALTKTNLEQRGWRFLPLMDLDPISEEEMRSRKFIDQPGHARITSASEG